MTTMFKKALSAICVGSMALSSLAMSAGAVEIADDTNIHNETTTSGAFTGQAYLLSDVENTENAPSPRSSMNIWSHKPLSGVEWSLPFECTSTNPYWKLDIVNSNSKAYQVEITYGSAYGRVVDSFRVSANSGYQRWSTIPCTPGQYYVNVISSQQSMTGNISLRIGSSLSSLDVNGGKG